MELLVDEVDRTLEAYRVELLERQQIDDLDEQIARFSLLFNLCLWFHDAIYDPKKADNEVKSNELFQEFANAVELSEHDQNLVSWVILDTIKHKMTNGPALEDPLYKDLSSYFLDADLSILCASDAVYDDYAERIFLEYEFVGRQTYCEKRPAVLQNLISANPYFTSYYR